MMQWFRQRRMTGGVMFGPPAWMPARLESAFEPDGPSPIPDACALSRERREMAAFVEEIGVARCSATIPALADQLRDLGEARVRALILNLLPTQPEFALPSALTRLALDDLRGGLGAIQQAVNARRILIVADAHDRPTLRAWRHALRGYSGAGRKLWQIRPLLNRYPQAHPTVLMWSLHHKRLPVDALPSRVQRVLVDPVSCWAIGRWLRTGRPMRERPIQVFLQQDRDAGPSARVLMGRIGETIAEFCGRFSLHLKDRQVIANGMLAGMQVDPAAARIDAATESLSFREPAAPEHPTACLACGWCGDVCPTALQPMHLLELAQRIPTGLEMAQGLRGNASATAGGTAPPATAGAGDAVRLLRTREAAETAHCIGCGLCSYVCPARLPLTQEIVRLRLRVLSATDRPPLRVPKAPGKGASS
jgi:electron transport complex protein RnfC